MHRSKELLLNHEQTAKQFVYNSICANCVIREGQCRNFYAGDLEKCYKECWHYAKAVNAVTKILIKYDK